MQKALKTCKVCGKQYEACFSVYVGNNVYRWQDVACCPEHGAEYFEAVERSRRPADQNPPADVEAEITDQVETESIVEAENESLKKPTTKRKRVKE